MICLNFTKGGLRRGLEASEGGLLKGVKKGLEGGLEKGLQGGLEEGGTLNFEGGL